MVKIYETVILFQVCRSTDHFQLYSLTPPKGRGILKVYAAVYFSFPFFFLSLFLQFKKISIGHSSAVAVENM